MQIKKRLVLILFVFLMGFTVYGSVADNIEMPKVHFFQDYHYEKGTRGKSLFLFSNTTLSEEHVGNVTLFNSVLRISDEFTGNVISLFSTVYIEEGAEVMGRIRTLSSNIYILESEIGSIASPGTPFIFFMGIFQNVNHGNGYTVYNDSVPIIIIYLFIGLLREIACLVILGMKRGFLEQGSVLLVYEPFNVIQNGLFLYFLVVSLAVVFLISVVGVGITALIVIGAFFLSLVGQTSLSMLIGHFVAERLKIPTRTYSNMIIGGIIIEIISFIPYLGWITNLVFMPILCFGILATNTMNGLIRKRFYQVPYGVAVRAQSDMDSIRKIIMKDNK